MSEWYEMVEAEEPLVQGDILFRCPVFFPDTDIDYSSLESPAKIKFELSERDVVVMTQSCDIQKGKPKTNILLCPLSNLSSIPKEGHLGNLKDNKITSLHLLGKHEKDGEMSLEYLIVDFTTVYTVPLGVLNNWRKTLGVRPRLRAPYMELMAQRFGYQFMRIGLDDRHQPEISDLIQKWKGYRKTP